ncbi:MAG: flagellar hook-associated protein FlgL [Polyangiales bacterium]
MRVTDNMFFDLSRRSIQERRARFSEAQTQALEGKRVLAPSTDPQASARAHRARRREVQAEAHQRSIDSGLMQVEVADAALSNAGEVLQMAREKALQAANDSLNADDRNAVAAEIDALRGALVDLANTRDGEGYVFGGYRKGTQAFTSGGVYQGDAAHRMLEVGPGVRMQVGVHGVEVFGAGGPDDIFAQLDDLATALRANDRDAVAAGADHIHAAHGRLLEARGDLGAQMQQLSIAKTVRTQAADHALADQQDAVGIDSVDAVLQLNQAQRALADAIQIAAQIPPPSLLSQG